MDTASWLVFRSGRFLTWVRLGQYHPGFEEIAWTTHDGMPVAEIGDDEQPPLGDYLCQVELELPPK
jgi:hypothetical protein